MLSYVHVGVNAQKYVVLRVRGHHLRFGLHFQAMVSAIRGQSLPHDEDVSITFAFPKKTIAHSAFMAYFRAGFCEELLKYGAVRQPVWSSVAPSRPRSRAVASVGGAGMVMVGAGALCRASWEAHV